MVAQKKGNTIVAKIISEFQDRNRAEIRKWRQALDLANDIATPRTYVLQDLYDNLRSDGHFISQVHMRKAATLCNPFEIIDKKTGDSIVEKTELFNNEWFINVIDAALDSIFYGYTVLELVNPETMDFEIIPRRNTVGRKNFILFEASGEKGVDISTGFETTLLHCNKPNNLGLMADLCGLLIWKRNAQQSWAEFTERFGMPLISATTTKTSKQDIAKIESMLGALGEAAQAVLPEGTTIDIKPFTLGDSYKVYDQQIYRINQELSEPILGGTMITSDGSSRSQSEVHERNLDEKLSLMDKRFVEFIINNQLLPIMQAWGWNVNPETDKFRFEPSFELSLKEHWEIVSGVMQQYTVDQEWLSKRFNIPIVGEKQQQLAMPINASLSANFR